MTWDEKAEDYAVAHHTYEHLDASENALYVSGFMRGARWQREALLSDETILRALNAEEPRAATDNLADWGESSIARMRAALAAALGEDESNE